MSDKDELDELNHIGDGRILATKDELLSLKKKWLIDEIKIMQHQAFNVLKSAKAVGEWGDIRINQLERDKEV